MLNLKDNFTFEKLINILLVKVPIRFFKKSVVTIAPRINSSPARRVFLYFKTDPYFSRYLVRKYSHPNNAEILVMVEVLNNLGFVVDVVDRDVVETELEVLFSREYDFYIANAAGNSAPLHELILRKLNFKSFLVFASGPEPTTNNRLTLARHAAFDLRCGFKSVPRRIVEGGPFEHRFVGAAGIFYVGNAFSRATYQHLRVPLFRVRPSTSPDIKYDDEALHRKSAGSFLYFGGNGLICKGLDLVLEAFDALEGVTLDVCAPLGEVDFWEYYRPLLSRNSNIHLRGFVPVGSRMFSEITNRATYVIFPGSSEGCATSVVTCMRRGLIPVVTKETGVDVGSFGYEIQEASVSAIRTLVKNLSELDVEQRVRRGKETYNASCEYTIQNFESDFEVGIRTMLRQVVK